MADAAAAAATPRKRSRAGKDTPTALTAFKKQLVLISYRH